MISIEAERRIQEKRHRTHVVIEYATWAAGALHVLLVPTFYWLKAMPLVVFNIGSVIVWALAKLGNRRGHHRTAIVLIAAEVVLHAIFATAFMSWSSGFHYYLCPLMPFILFMEQFKLRGSVLTCVGVLLVYAALKATTDGAPMVPVDPRAMRVLSFANLFSAMACLAVVSVAFHHASIDAESTMERLAMTDQLTNLANRRLMMQMLQEQQRRANESFSVIICDVDHFKKINDTYGHDCGDHVLQVVASTLRSGVRETDLVARWGGEEFVVFLPATSVDGAAAVAEKLRALVSAAPLVFEEHTIRVSMTFGVTSAFQGESIDECLRRADRALYEGKTGGRDRVVSTSPMLVAAVA